MKSLVKKIAQHHYYLNLKSPFLLSMRLYYILEEGIHFCHHSPDDN